MMVDCGGGTVDLTTLKLLENKGLSEIIECTEDSCGSAFIDKGFINFLGQKLGNDAIELFKSNNYRQFQYIIQEFCQWVKLPFTGDLNEYRPYYLDIEEIAQYVSEETKFKMEENDWIIEIKYNDVKNMFDPVIDKIISLIQHLQLQEKCSTILLVGGLSESTYLQKRIKEEFQHTLKNIYIPSQPMAAISRGAALYGLNPNDVGSVRVLKYTYGIKVRNYWVSFFGFINYIYIACFTKLLFYIYFR
jgi:molecular chaperone DnaK (HSP70)